MRDSHQEWLDMYNTQINSGISVEEWCLQNNIKYKTFLSRLGTLRKLGLLPFSFIIVATVKFVVIIKEFLCHLKLQGILFHSKKRLFYIIFNLKFLLQMLL